MFSGIVTGDIQSLLETNSRLSSQTTRQQSEDMIQKQLAAFERLLLHSISRFSKENLYHMLRHVARWAQNEQTQEHQIVSVSAFKLNSIQQLKECVSSMKEKRIHKSVDDEHVCKYYELFLNDLLYLKDLKKYFDDEIYKSLMRYHYEPSVGKNNTQTVPMKDTRQLERKGKSRYVTHGTDDEDSGHGSQAESNERSKLGRNRRKKGKAAMNSEAVTSEAETRYRNTVCELQDILKKWDGLLSENSLDLNDFDPDSYHELMQFTNYSQFEPILRLVPDIFAKCYKCIDLAKVWLQESNIVLKDIPLPSSPNDIGEGNKEESTPSGEQQSTPREFIKEVREIKSQLSDIEKSIEADEQKLEQYKREMNQLSNRDDRFSKLSSEFDKIDSVLTLAAGDYQKSKTEQYAVASKLRGCPRGSYDYTEMKDKLKRIDKEVSENHWKMKLLEFEKAMIEEDYAVESGVRPSFIRFIGDTKDKMQELQEGVQAKKEEKLKLDKQLALIKTNTDRMKNIMRTYLGSAGTRADQSMNREKTLSSQASDDGTVDLSEFQLENGNETDVDSAGPYDNSPGRYEVTVPLDSGRCSKTMSTFSNENIKTDKRSPGKYLPNNDESLLVGKKRDKLNESVEPNILTPGRYEVIAPIPGDSKSNDSSSASTENLEPHRKNKNRYETIEPLPSTRSSKESLEIKKENVKPYSKSVDRYRPIHIASSEINTEETEAMEENAEFFINKHNRYETVKLMSASKNPTVTPFTKGENNKRRPTSLRSDTSDEKYAQGLKRNTKRLK